MLMGVKFFATTRKNMTEEETLTKSEQAAVLRCDWKRKNSPTEFVAL